MISRSLAYLRGQAIALLALFVALSGSAYAVSQVTSKQIKDNTVASVDIRDRSLRAKDFRAGQLPAGAKGEQGPAGPKGDTGPAGPSDAYVGNLITNTDSAARLNNAGVKVLELTNLPAGQYMVVAKGRIANSESFGNTVQCKLLDGNTSMGTDWAVLEASGGSYSATVQHFMLMSDLTVAASTTKSVSVSCALGAQATEMVSVLDAKIMAIRVGAVH